MRPIILDEDTRRKILEDMAAKLYNARTYTEFSYTYKPASTHPTDGKIKVIFKPLAWIKMTTLVQECSTECAWHGTVTTNEERTAFTVHDILVYPQKVAGTTVDIDEVHYEAWHQALDNESYNTLRLQGHSHVNMGASPSGVDTNLYANMLQTLGPDSFYIFMIMNKSHMTWWNIYDLRNNCIYEREDIDYEIEGNFNTKAWYLEESKAKFAARTYSYQNPITTPSTYEPMDTKALDNYLFGDIEDESDAFYVSDRYNGNYANIYDRKPAKPPKDLPISKQGKGGGKHGSK